MSKMGQCVLTVLLPVALALLLSGEQAQAQCRGRQYRGQQLNMMTPQLQYGMQTMLQRQQSYAMLTGLQQQQQYAQWVAWQQQQQYASLLALQQQQYALQQRALAAQLLAGR